MEPGLPADGAHGERPQAAVHHHLRPNIGYWKVFVKLHVYEAGCAAKLAIER